MSILSPGLNVFSYAAKVKRPLILDGAIGDMLRNKNIPDQYLWMSYLNLKAPETVFKLHKRYVKAGADIITTNTFRSNPASFYNLKDDFVKFAKAGVELALEAAKGKNILVAASNAPAEDCYKVKRELSYKELVSNHHKHIGLLMDSGADLILNETQSHLDEIIIICEFCGKKNIPFILSLFFDENLKLLSGEKVTYAIEIIKDYAPLAIGFNCIKPSVFEKLPHKVFKACSWGMYMNCGTGSYSDEKIRSCLSPMEYLEHIKKYTPLSPSFIGGCCGSTPNHIKLIKEYFYE